MAMSPDEALRFIQGAMRLGQITYSRHRSEDEHHVSIADQYAAVMSATHARWDRERGNWEISGDGADGDPITVIFAIVDNRVHTVTAFGGRHRD